MTTKATSMISNSVTTTEPTVEEWEEALCGLDNVRRIYCPEGTYVPIEFLITKQVALTSAEKTIAEIQTVFDESNEIISANLDLRNALSLAVEAMEEVYGCLPLTPMTGLKILTAALKKVKGEVK